MYACACVCHRFFSLNREGFGSCVNCSVVFRRNKIQVSLMGVDYKGGRRSRWNGYKRKYARLAYLSSENYYIDAFFSYNWYTQLVGGLRKFFEIPVDITVSDIKPQIWQQLFEKKIQTSQSLPYCLLSLSKRTICLFPDFCHSCTILTKIYDSNLVGCAESVNSALNNNHSVLEKCSRTKQTLLIFISFRLS